MANNYWSISTCIAICLLVSSNCWCNNGKKKLIRTSYGSEPNHRMYSKGPINSPPEHGKPNEYDQTMPEEEVNPQCSPDEIVKCDFNQEHLTNCVKCDMKTVDMQRFIKCEDILEGSLQNMTAYGGYETNDSIVMVCSIVNRFLRCSVPLVFRFCNDCAVHQFVKKYRPHLELCHLISPQMPYSVSDAKYPIEIYE
ncbi:hypothetical protein RDWZM_003462 [Blomia tropicalis]|uniref:Uncharacterized protein n=1 Tax=Blomia tropicalis TaxID=40697 RepID=A0A9Q0MFV4_BLOTA|nr:hypothetical protein RDWZM_003462 [Blomia tropicalis]